MKIEEITQCIKECTKCPGHKKVKKLQPACGLGGKSPIIMLVAHRAEEAAIQIGEPISDVQQKLIKQLLADSVINKKDVYITNLIKCPIEKSEQCKEWLWEEIQEIQPRVVVPLGKEVADILIKTTKKLKIDSMVGQEYRVKYCNAFLIPCYSLTQMINSPKLLDKAGLIFSKVKLRTSKIVGKIGEDFVQRLLLGAGVDCQRTKNIEETASQFDLECKVGRKKFTVEVKYDVKAQFTGNLAIEVGNSRKDEPSGIYKTTADIIVYVIRDDRSLTAWAIPTKTLIKYVENNAPKRKVNAAGDNNAELCLYDDFEILKAFSRIDNVDEKTRKKNVRGLLT